MLKYSKWKAADITTALKEGRKPVPGPAQSQEEEFLNESSFQSQSDTNANFINNEQTLRQNSAPATQMGYQNENTEIPTSNFDFQFPNDTQIDVLHNVNVQSYSTPEFQNTQQNQNHSHSSFGYNSSNGQSQFQQINSDQSPPEYQQVSRPKQAQQQMDYNSNSFDQNNYQDNGNSNNNFNFGSSNQNNNSQMEYQYYQNQNSSPTVRSNENSPQNSFQQAQPPPNYSFSTINSQQNEQQRPQIPIQYVQPIQQTNSNSGSNSNSNSFTSSQQQNYNDSSNYNKWQSHSNDNNNQVTQINIQQKVHYQKPMHPPIQYPNRPDFDQSYRFARFAVSALQFEDVPAAIYNLKRSLAQLGVRVD